MLNTRIEKNSVSQTSQKYNTERRTYQNFSCYCKLHCKFNDKLFTQVRTKWLADNLGYLKHSFPSLRQNI